jgi:putative phosphoesterase
MRIAALYDVHGNLPALDAVLDDIGRDGGVELIVIGGDVYPGPMSDAVMSRLRSCGIPYRAIAGNGERVVLEAVDGAWTDTLPPAARIGIEWCARTIAREHEQEIRSWPATLRLEVPATGRVLFVHATPRNDTEIFTERTSDAAVRAAFSGAEADVVVCGHTHIQFDRRLDGVRIVNAGSIGMPFDEAGAYWALIDAGAVTLRRTRYDAAAAGETLSGSSYPAVEQFVAQYVVSPPSRAQMLETYERVQLR